MTEISIEECKQKMEEASARFSNVSFQAFVRAGQALYVGTPAVFDNCDLRGLIIAGPVTVNIYGAETLLDANTRISVKGIFIARDVDLNGAILDYTLLPLSCTSVGLKDSSNRLFRQLLYHALSIDCDEAKALRKIPANIDVASKFHHFHECEDKLGNALDASDTNPE